MKIINFMFIFQAEKDLIIPNDIKMIPNDNKMNKKIAHRSKCCFKKQVSIESPVRNAFKKS